MTGSAFRQLFGLSGTGGRLSLLLWTALFQISAVVLYMRGSLATATPMSALPLYVFFGFSFTAWIGAVVRRLHDIGRSGIFAVLFPIPLFGLGLVIWALFAEPRPVDPDRHAPAPRYAVGIAALILIAVFLSSRAFWTLHRMPSDHMRPNLDTGSAFLRLDLGQETLQRGRMVAYLLPGPDAVPRLYLSRIIATEGQTVALIDGVPSVDGSVARREAADCDRMAPCQREILPSGESYLVRDTGGGSRRALEAFAVPPGSVFVLGDNRDAVLTDPAAVELGGPGFIPSAALRGRVVPLSFGGQT